jgi:hypothetical protein
MLHFENFIYGGFPSDLHHSCAEWLGLCALPVQQYLLGSASGWRVRGADMHGAVAVPDSQSFTTPLQLAHSFHIAEQHSHHTVHTPACVLSIQLVCHLDWHSAGLLSSQAAKDMLHCTSALLVG